VSTATRVPETHELTGDDARATFARIGPGRLAVDAFQRLRAADGTSHSRSLAFMVCLLLVQGLVVLLGLATAFGTVSLTATIADTIGSAVPGPASSVLSDAVDQARRFGRSDPYVPLTIGLLGLLVTGTVAMGQVERALNRIYGVERDRPTVRKYSRAFVLAVSVGGLLAAAFLLLGFGGTSTTAAGRSVLWEIGRWPLALTLVTGGLAVLLRFSPNRRQPGPAWLALGSITAVALWTLSTVALALTFRLASTFPETYGPLAGVVALLLWAYLSSLAVFYGVAVAAQLEAVRSGSGEPAAAEAQPAPARTAEATAA
jgi:YihY family inner membrane protein